MLNFIFAFISIGFLFFSGCESSQEEQISSISESANETQTTEQQKFIDLKIAVNTTNDSKQVKRVQYSDIAKMTLSIFYANGQEFSSGINLQKNDSVWSTNIENLPVEEYPFVFKIEVFNSSNTKIMSGEISQKVTESNTSFDIPVSIVDSENSIVLMPVIEEINASLPMADGRIKITFNIYNPAGDALTYAIEKDASSSGSFINSDNTNAISGNLGSSENINLDIFLKDENFDLNQTYSHSLIVKNSFGDSFKKFFTIQNSPDESLKNSGVSVSLAPVVDNIMITQDEDNLSITAVINSDLADSITGYEWSLKNSSFTLKNTNSKTVTLTNFTGIIDDTILLTVTSDNSVAETFNYKLLMGETQTEDEPIDFNLPKTYEYTQYGEIQLPDLDLKVINNIWGTSILNQKAFVSNDDSKKVFPVGWEWYWTHANSSILSYPAIAYGRRPWDSTSTTTNLPILVGKIETFKVDYKVQVTSSHRHNLAFDIWLVNSLSGDLPSNRTHEIMIWTDRKQGGSLGDFVPIGYPTITGTFTSNNITYDIYEGMNGNFKVISFLRQDADDDSLDRDEVIKVDEFLDFLIAQNKISSSLYLIDLELGTEVMEGTGSAIFSKFDIEFATK
jgi:hypothetical protein